MSKLLRWALLLSLLGFTARAIFAAETCSQAAASLESYAVLLRQMNRDAAATLMHERAEQLDVACRPRSGGSVFLGFDPATSLLEYAQALRQRGDESKATEVKALADAYLSENARSFATQQSQGRGPPPSPVPVKDHSKRLEFRGYSIQPPSGGDWYIAFSLKPNRVDFIKKTDTATRTYGALAWSGPVPVGLKTPEEFLEYVKKAIVGNMDPARFMTTKLEAALNKTSAASCVTYDVTFQDHHPPHLEGTILLLDVHGYRCLHPNLPAWEVDVSYSERSKTGGIDPLLREEGDAFIRGVRITPLN